MSVCITTFNRAALLDRTIASIAAQSRQPDEVILSDDCSSDETAAVVEKWRSVFPVFKYRRNAANLYMPGNLNACVSAATGDYVANLHDADEFHPTLLQKWEAALDRYPSAGFVFCGVRAGDLADPDEANPRVERLNRSTEIHRYSRGLAYLHDVAPLTRGHEFFERHFLHTTYSIVWGTVMARRDAYQKLLPFDEQFGFISDVDMWMRMCLVFDVAYIREPLIHLDDSPTAERGFDWKRTEAFRTTQRSNIERFYRSSPQRLALELTRHARLFRRFYLRKIVALAARRRPLLAAEGVRLLLGRHQLLSRPPGGRCRTTDS